MKIDPVFLVAPAAPPPTVPTRRAFLLAGGAFAFGSLVGGACGYSIGAAKGVPVETAGEKGDGELGSSGDARLDALRRLAVKAPIEELVKNWNEFCADFFFDYLDDLPLWTGADRLVDWALSHPNETSPPFLTTLLQFTAVDKRSPELSLKRFERDLRELRSKRSK